MTYIVATIVVEDDNGERLAVQDCGADGLEITGGAMLTTEDACRLGRFLHSWAHPNLPDLDAPPESDAD